MPGYLSRPRVVVHHGKSNPIAIGKSNPIAIALARADESSRPVVRAFFNYIARKISGLSEKEICRLSDDKITLLINTELSRLSEADKNNLVDKELSNLLTIVNSIMCVLATCKDEEMTSLLLNGSRKIIDFLFDLPFVVKFFDDVFLYGACSFGLIFFTFVCQMMHIRLSSSKPPNSTATTTNAAQGRLRSAKRSIFLSKYTRKPDLKGFKDIGGIYSQELLSGVTQEVEPHQEGTYRAVVPSTKSTDICSSGKGKLIM